MRIFDKKNQKATSEWNRINSAIMSSGNKRQLTTKEVHRFEEIVPQHDPRRFSDTTLIAENRGKQHWHNLGEYEPICSSHPTWTIDDVGDRKSLYWPYIPNDAELMEEIYAHRKGARQLVQEHKQHIGHQITEDSKNLYNRREGF